MEAKEIFDKYHGSYFLMDRDDVYNYYKSFNISNETERKWRIDNIDSLKRRLSKTKNMKDISNYFSIICEYCVQLKSESDLLWLLEYNINNSQKLDSNTLLKNVNSLLNYAHIIKPKKKKKQFVSSCLALLIQNMNDGVTISDDYIENGCFPNYLTKELLLTKIQQTVEYYK